MDFDMIVIGSGQAGVPLAARLAEAGWKVMLAERSKLGGTCVNHGCTPTKTMMASARAAHAARRVGRLGVHAGGVEVDLAAVVDRKDEIVNRWREGVRRRLDRAGANLTVIAGEARFVGPREVEVNGDRHRGKNVAINTGGRPAVPPIEGLGQVESLDNDSVMQLRERPEHLIVLGGGYIGCEFGQMFRRFGSKVTIVQRASHLLDREDEEISEAIEEVFRGEGIELRVGREAIGVEARNAGIALSLDDGTSISGSHLLVAAGRVPNVEALNLDAAGVELDEGGHVRIDDEYRTSADGVYAVGDVTGGPQFTHASWDDHRILFDLLTGQGRRTRADRVIPHTVFTDPQVAGVGLSERQARARDLEHEVASIPFGRIARAVEIDETAGIVKVLIDPTSERILGASIVGAEAGELIHIFEVLMVAGASARAIVDSEMAHPTFAEGVQTAVMSLDRYAL